MQYRTMRLVILMLTTLSLYKPNLHITPMASGEYYVDHINFMPCTTLAPLAMLLRPYKGASFKKKNLL